MHSSTRDGKTGKRERGSTLLEVMITASIASGIILAVMQAVTFSTQSAKSVQASADWTSLISTLTLATQNSCACANMFGIPQLPDCSGPNPSGLPLLPALGSPPGPFVSTSSYAYCSDPAPSGFLTGSAVTPPTCASTATVSANAPALDALSVGGTPLLSTCTTGCSAGPPGGIIAQQINLRTMTGPSGGIGTVTIPYALSDLPAGCSGMSPIGASGTTYAMWLDTLYLEVYAVKITKNPATNAWGPAPGGSAYLYAGIGTNNAVNGIQVQALRCGGAGASYNSVSTTGVIVSCFAASNQALLACTQMGGTLAGPSVFPQCQLPRLPLGPSTSLSMPSVAGVAGERLAFQQLGWGTPAVTDVAQGIGLNTDFGSSAPTNTAMWFSAGPTGEFDWFTGSGTSQLLQATTWPGFGPLVTVGSSGMSNYLSIGALQDATPTAANIIMLWGGIGEKIMLYPNLLTNNIGPGDDSIGVYVGNQSGTNYSQMSFSNGASSDFNYFGDFIFRSNSGNTEELRLNNSGMQIATGATGNVDLVFGGLAGLFNSEADYIAWGGAASSNANGSGQGSQPAHSLSIWTYITSASVSAEALRIDSNQNLTVFGNSLFVGPGVAQPSIYFGSATGGGSIWSNLAGGAGTGDLNFSVGGSARLHIDGNGAVVINHETVLPPAPGATVGNIPHNCTTVLGSGGPISCSIAEMSLALCAAAQIAISGGYGLSGSGTVFANLPFPLTAGSAPIGWAAQCTGGTGTILAYAICCDL